MNKQIIIVMILLSAMVLAGCCKDDSTEANGIIGSTNVELDAKTETVRAKENLLGNLVADAIAADIRDKKHSIDFAAINGGSIRFNREKRPDGVYAKGDLSSEMIDEMIPFGNFSVIVVVTGAELKQIFERSVSEVETARGQYLNVSSEVKVIYNLSNPPQVVNNTVTPEVISSPGSRVISIKINGNEIVETSTYKVVVPDFIADGNDGYVTFASIPNERKTPVDELQVNALRDYIILNSPVNPKIEGRLTFQ